MCFAWNEQSQQEAAGGAVEAAEGSEATAPSPAAMAPSLSAEGNVVNGVVKATEGFAAIAPSPAAEVVEAAVEDTAAEREEEEAAEEEEEEEEVVVVDVVVKGEEGTPPPPESICRSTDLESEADGLQEGLQDGLQGGLQGGPQLHPHCSVTSKLLRGAPAIAPTADAAAEREEEEEEDDSNAGGDPTHCERDPQCTRGYRHGGRGGLCSARDAQGNSDARDAQGNSARATARWAARLPKDNTPVDGAAEEEGSLQPPRSFACPDCGASFGTHQGLGGHRRGCLMRSSMAERAMPPPPPPPPPQQQQQQQQQQQPCTHGRQSARGAATHRALAISRRELVARDRARAVQRVLDLLIRVADAAAVPGTPGTQRLC